MTGGDNSLFWGSGTGAFVVKTKNNKNYIRYSAHAQTPPMQYGWDFAASNVIKTASEVRPYSLHVLYLIAY